MAFGRCKARFRCLAKRMDYQQIETFVNVIMAAFVLHNVCEIHREVFNQEWFDEPQVNIPNVALAGAQDAANVDGIAVRDTLVNYFRNN